MQDHIGTACIKRPVGHRAHGDTWRASTCSLTPAHGDALRVFHATGEILK